MLSLLPICILFTLDTLSAPSTIHSSITSLFQSLEWPSGSVLISLPLDNDEPSTSWDIIKLNEQIEAAASHWISFDSIIHLDASTSITESFANGAAMCEPGYIFILDASIALHKNIGSMFEEENALVSPLLINPDGLTIKTAGMSLQLFSIFTPSRINAPLPTNRFEGYPIGYDDGSAIFSLSGLCLVTTTHVWHTINANVTFDRHWWDADLSYRAQQAGIDLVLKYNAQAIALATKQGPPKYGTNEDTERFVGDWFDYLLGRMHTLWGQYANVNVEWIIECGTGQELGFTTEALRFLLALKDRVPTNIQTVYCINELKKAEFQDVPLVERLSSLRPQSDWLAPVPPGLPPPLHLHVIHRDPGRYNTYSPHTGEQDSSHVIVGRSMFETDSVPSDWSTALDTVVSEIWVPSQFNVDTFSATFPISRLMILPELVDTFLFDPSLHSPIDIASHVPDTFVFLSIFKWERRKAWDILIDAFLTAFPSSNSGVELWLRCTVDEQNEQEYRDFVSDRDASHIHFLDSLVPFTRLPSIYAAADVFVLPSRGEGWGLPAMEAMAMALPVIATYWSGTTAFMNNSTAYLLETDGLEPAAIDGHQWASPSTAHLIKLMKYAESHRSEGIAMGKRAREHIVAHFSSHVVAERVLQHIDRLRVHGRKEKDVRDWIEKCHQREATIESRRLRRLAEDKEEEEWIAEKGEMQTHSKEWGLLHLWDS